MSSAGRARVAGKAGRIAALSVAPERIGRTWEAQLNDLHELYRKQGIALVFRSPPEVQITGRSASGIRGHLTGKGPPDYVGVAGPLALMAEAKTTAERRWPLSMVQPHQAQRMTEWEAQDRRNVAVVLVWMREPNVRAVLPWEDLRNRWEAWRDGRAAIGEASLTAEQVARLGLPFGPCGWLDPLLSWAVARLRA